MDLILKNDPKKKLQHVRGIFFLGGFFLKVLFFSGFSLIIPIVMIIFIILRIAFRYMLSEGGTGVAPLWILLTSVLSVSLSQTLSTSILFCCFFIRFAYCFMYAILVSQAILTWLPYEGMIDRQPVNVLLRCSLFFWHHF